MGGGVRQVDQIKICSGGMLIDNEKDIADHLNNYFINVGEDIANKFSSHATSTDSSNLSCRSIPDSIFLYPVDYREVSNVLMSLKNNSAPGCDGVRARVIKELRDSLVPPLVFIINLCFETGRFPTDLKRSIVTPVFKAGDRSSPGNYRPISVTSQFSKIIEKLIYIRLNNHFNRHNVISSRQFGFREACSTGDALFGCLESIYTSINDNRRVLAIFLDLAKAFDTVSHELLLNKLELYGIRGTALSLLKSYLTNRTQSVRIRDTRSAPMVVRCGVPQGTVLGPLLFSVYINDLLESEIGGEIIAYADDTVVVFSDYDWEHVKRKSEEGISRVKKWLNKNHLALNVGKTNCIAFSTQTTGQPSFDNLILHSCIQGDCLCTDAIQRVSETKYLGIVIDSRLRWDRHVEFLTKRIKKLVYLFYKLRLIFNKYFLIMIYRSFAESVLSYGIIAWGSACASILEPLQIVQKYILKVILFKSRGFPTVQLFAEAGLLSIKGLYCLKSVVYMHRHPSKRRIVDHSYDTRSRTVCTLAVPRMRLSHTQRSLLYTGPKLYNLLPNDLKRVNNVSLFSKKVYSHLHTNMSTFNI